MAPGVLRERLMILDERKIGVTWIMTILQCLAPRRFLLRVTVTILG